MSMRRLLPFILLLAATPSLADAPLHWRKPAVDNSTGQCIFYLPDPMPNGWAVERVVIVYDGRELTPDEQARVDLGALDHECDIWLRLYVRTPDGPLVLDGPHAEIKDLEGRDA
jgi:hypothetical protein